MKYYKKKGQNTMKLIISLLLCSLLIGSLASQAAEITQNPVPIQDQETQQDETLP
jgi:hypothetical protein